MEGKTTCGGDGIETIQEFINGPKEKIIKKGRKRKLEVPPQQQ